MTKNYYLMFAITAVGFFSLAFGEPIPGAENVCNTTITIKSDKT